MKEIPLTKGQVALVDDEDFEWLNQWRWFAKSGGKRYGFKVVRSAGTAQTRFGTPKCVLLVMAREILGLQLGDGMQTRFINGDRLDHRRENLMVVPQGASRVRQQPVREVIESKPRRRIIERKLPERDFFITHNGRDFVKVWA